MARVGDPVTVVGEGRSGVGLPLPAEVAVEPGEDPLADVTGLQVALVEVEFTAGRIGDAAAVPPGLPDHPGGRALGPERPVRRGRLVEVEEAVGLPLDQQGGRLDPAQVGHRGDTAGVGEQRGGRCGAIAAGVQGADGVAGLGHEVQTGEGVDPGRVEVRRRQRPALADEVEPVAPLPLVGAGDSGGGVVRVERVDQVVPCDQRDERVDAVVDRGRRQLDGAAVRAAEHADPRVAGGVEGDEVGLGAVVGGTLAAQEVDQPRGGPAVYARVVQRDQTAGRAEAEPGVDEGDIAALGEGLADRVGRAVGLAATEAVRGEHGRSRVSLVDARRPVQVGIDRAGVAARLDRELQCRDGVSAGRGRGGAWTREGR